jgi:hypothetical protein
LKGRGEEGIKIEDQKMTLRSRGRHAVHGAAETEAFLSRL